MRTTIPTPRGRVRAHRVTQVRRNPGKSTRKILPGPNGLAHAWDPVTPFVHNDVLYDWATIVGKLLLKQGVKFGIGGMYIEFQNVASPGDPVAAPAVDRAGGAAYYADLATSPDTDYLRVPLIAGTLNSTDADLFPGGNEATFFAQTSGVAGVHGKPFSDANNSVVFGGALVAFVDEDDPTQDLVFSRFYFGEADQQPKLATSQIGLEWPVRFD